jgi:protein-L-isoaspartate(D-aspartate) O-methyltransferase
MPAGPDELRMQMVEGLEREGYIQSRAVKAAMSEVPRELFVPDAYRAYAYLDTPLEIGHGQTISAPHMVAMMLELLEIERNSVVLEVGGGLGYHAAVASRVAKNGMIYSVEIIPELAEEARRRLNMCGCENVEVHVGDGGSGLPEKAPFDRIMMACAAPAIPEPLTEQLKYGGKIVAPIGEPELQTLVLGVKSGDVIRKANHGYCRFVPMRGKWGF